MKRRPDADAACTSYQHSGTNYRCIAFPSWSFSLRPPTWGTRLSKHHQPRFTPCPLSNFGYGTKFKNNIFRHGAHFQGAQIQPKAFSSKCTMACCGWVLIMFTHYSCDEILMISVIEHSKKKRLKAHFWVQILLNESLAYSLWCFCLFAEVTGKAIEETTAVILRIFHERRSKNHMPRISRRY